MSSAKSKPVNRVMTFDVLNILACIAVIALHHNGLVHSFDGSIAWKQSLVIECVCYWCVPVFLMLSGASLLGYRSRYTTQTFMYKRCLRTVIPWLVWSVIQLVWKTHTGQLSIEDPTLKNSVQLVLSNQVEGTYWFFTTLFGCYLAIPVFSLLVSNRKALWYTVALNFIFSASIPILCKWIGITWSLPIPIVGACFIYVLLGYLLKNGIQSKKCRYILYVIGISCMIFRFIYTYKLSFVSKTTDTSIKGFQYFHAVLYSAAIWVAAVHFKWQRLPLFIKNRLPFLASCSFGIYLIHRIVMYYELELLPFSTHRFVWRILCIPLTYIISLGIVALARKLPIVRHIF